LPELLQSVLKENDTKARELRARFQNAGVFVVSIVSGPGAGKTALLEKTLAALQPHSRVAALVGDLATEFDSERLARTGAQVRQILTGTVCHLDAEMVDTALEGWKLDELDYLFIENVGNLVCPAAYDLGEDARVVLLSVTQGEDKPLKYAPIFHGSDLAMVSKADLAHAVEFDFSAVRRNIAAVSPGVPILVVSAKTGLGMDHWFAMLAARSVTI